ncbi:juvenile hormone esterase-like [Haematobia irritans]|uniref:juvenile hormone esterase-like n=1 Tax=Haematobia irritans TaxID=7368 RepID=UPI003F4FDF2D
MFLGLLLLLTVQLNFLESVRAGGLKSPVVCPENSGCMRGTIMPGYKGSPFYAFLGVPYARPPVGPLRFSNSQPYPKWKGIKDVTEPKEDCVQQSPLFVDTPILGSEDCLYLNIYTPMDVKYTKAKLPVMFYIYGGGYVSGSANPNIVGPEYFMDTQEVIVVVPNYRLGIFGFLSTSDSVVPGNFGLKDQRMAMRWVKDNIAEFGGDPNRVTIFGQSVGGMSAHLHMLSNHSERYFKRVIAMSGVATLPAFFQENPLAVARATAKNLNITNSHNITSTELLEAFRSKDIETIFAAVNGLRRWVNYPITSYCVVVESPDSPDPFFTQKPSDILAQGNYIPAPFMTGLVPEEGAPYSIPIWEFPHIRDSFNNNFNETVKLTLLLPENVTSAQLSKIINEYYEGKEMLTKQGSLDMYTDALFAHPFYQNTKIFAHTVDNNEFPLYLYRYNFKGRYSYASVFGASNDDYGVVHCDELFSTWRQPALVPDFPKNSTEAKAAEKLTKIFVSFAYGKLSKSIPQCTKENYPRESLSSICDYISFQNGPGNSIRVTTDNTFDVQRMRIWEPIY